MDLISADAVVSDKFFVTSCEEQMPFPEFVARMDDSKKRNGPVYYAQVCLSSDHFLKTKKPLCDVM